VVRVPAKRIDVIAHCWVNNEHYISARTEIWRKVVVEFNENKDIALSLPQQEILLTHRDAD